jgi:hypothetical protein
VIDSYTSIVLERLPKVIPKCEMSYFARVKRSERIRVTHTQHRIFFALTHGNRIFPRFIARIGFLYLGFLEPLTKITANRIAVTIHATILGLSQPRDIVSWTDAKVRLL